MILSMFNIIEHKYIFSLYVRYEMIQQFFDDFQVISSDANEVTHVLQITKLLFIYININKYVQIGNINIIQILSNEQHC